MLKRSNEFLIVPSLRVISSSACNAYCVANYRYKVEGVVDADPETVFSYIDPTPTSPRAKWDRAVKELHIIEQLDKAIQYNTFLSSLYLSFSYFSNWSKSGEELAFESNVEIMSACAYLYVSQRQTAKHIQYIDFDILIDFQR